MIADRALDLDGHLMGLKMACEGELYLVVSITDVTACICVVRRLCRGSEVTTREAVCEGGISPQGLDI